MKIRTTVYSHKVIDVIRFTLNDDFQVDAIYELMNQFAEKIASSKNGSVHIKVDRPLSSEELDHRMGVVAKNMEKRERYRNWYSRKYLESERAEYERLKAKFEKP